MEDKELQELEEFSLEDIINEFSDHPHAAPAAEEESSAEEEIPQEKTEETEEPTPASEVSAEI